MNQMGRIRNSLLLLIVRWNRVGNAGGIGISNVRDRDGRFYRAAFGALGWVKELSPQHFRSMQRRFKWIANRSLATGQGSAWRGDFNGILWVDFNDFQDDMVSQAYLATCLVTHIVLDRFSSRASLEDHEQVLRVLRVCDDHAARFAIRFDAVREGLGKMLHDAIAANTDEDRLKTLWLSPLDHARFDLARLLHRMPNKSPLPTGISTTNSNQ